MASRTARSLRHEYELYVEQEIENYKESIPRSAILAIGDEAASRLSSQPQLALTELLLLEEVDRLIFNRLRLPKYETWRKRRLKLQEEMRRPEHWGLTARDALVRTIDVAAAFSGASPNVVVADAGDERSALFLAANGCDVIAIEPHEEILQRVMTAAHQAGLGERVHPVSAPLNEFTPRSPLRAVVCSHAALADLTPRERARVIEVLQTATADGGVHLVQTIAAGAAAIEELRSTYRGWNVSVERADDDAPVFLARKNAAPHVESRVSH